MGNPRFRIEFVSIWGSTYALGEASWRGGAADHLPLYWCALVAGRTFHSQSTDLPAVLGWSEETWVSAPPVLVGAAVGS
jgi:hypothetical protein